MKKKKKKASPKKHKSKVKAKRRLKKDRIKRTARSAKKAKKKAVKKAPKTPISIIPPANSILLGRVEDYFAKIGVLALTLEYPLQAGQHLHILGHTTNLEQSADSLQIDHQSVMQANKGAGVGIKVTARVRRGDYVFLIQ